MPRASRYTAASYDVSDDLGSIDELVGLIHQQVETSLEDPETRQLALSIANGSYDWVVDPRTGEPAPVVKYHGRYYPVAPGTDQPAAVCKPRDFKCEVTAIWTFLVLNNRYIADLDGADVYSDLRTTLESGGGDCDDMTVAFCSLLRGIGYECVARVISLRGNSWDHIYPIVKVPNHGWVALDATEDGKLPGWEFATPAKTKDFDMGIGAQ